LGDHISQAGSLNDAKRLRFDFSHPKALEHAELVEIEQRVNALISRGITQVTKVMGIDDAKNSGAKAQFGEKYGDEVRVVSFDDASVFLLVFVVLKLLLVMRLMSTSASKEF